MEVYECAQAEWDANVKSGFQECGPSAPAAELRVTAMTPGAGDFGRTSFDVELRDARSRDPYLSARLSGEMQGLPKIPQAQAEALAQQLNACTAETCTLKTVCSKLYPWSSQKYCHQVLMVGEEVVTVQGTVKPEELFSMLKSAVVTEHLYCVCPKPHGGEGEIEVYECPQAEWDAVAHSESTQCGPSTPGSAVVV